MDADSDEDLLEEDEYVPSKRNQDDDDDDDDDENEEEDVMEIDDDDDEELMKPQPKNGRGGKATKATASKEKSTKPAAKGKPKAQSGGAQKKNTMKSIIEIDGDDDEDENRSRNTWAKSVRPSNSNSNINSRSNEVISLDVDDNSSLFTGKSATSQLTFEPAATTKKRQLPTSFSQTEKKGASNNSKGFSSGWDD